MKQVSLKSLKQGDYFKLKNSNTAPVWVRGEYDKQNKLFEICKAEDINHTNARKGDTNVFINFEY